VAILDGVVQSRLAFNVLSRREEKISLLLKRPSLTSLTVLKQSRQNNNNLHERSSLKAFFSLIFQAFIAFFSKLKGF
jgi:hypothetical protein